MGGQCDDRIEAQQRRGGSSHGSRMPLALRLQAQMRPRFLTRDFQGPATDHQVRICSGVWLRVVDNKACGSKHFWGSRMSTQRSRMGGLPE
jgi:hypothetical protein